MPGMAAEPASSCISPWPWISPWPCPSSPPAAPRATTAKAIATNPASTRDFDRCGSEPEGMPWGSPARDGSLPARRPGQPERGEQTDQLDRDGHDPDRVHPLGLGLEDRQASSAAGHVGEDQPREEKCRQRRRELGLRPDRHGGADREQHQHREDERNAQQRHLAEMLWDETGVDTGAHGGGEHHEDGGQDNGTRYVCLVLGHGRFSCTGGPVLTSFPPGAHPPPDRAPRDLRRRVIHSQVEIGARLMPLGFRLGPQNARSPLDSGLPSIAGTRFVPRCDARIIERAHLAAS